MTPEQLDELRQWVAEANPDAVYFEGYDDAIIGAADRCSKDMLIVYDVDKCIQVLMNRDGMDYEEASEFFEFNTRGCWAGDGTPLFLTRWPRED